MKAPPMSRRKMTPDTPRQNSRASLEGKQGHSDLEEQRWSAKERAIIARTK